MLQKFDLDTRDKKGCENFVADHLYRLPLKDRGCINHKFPDEHLQFIQRKNLPWFAHMVDYLISKKCPKNENFIKIRNSLQILNIIFGKIMNCFTRDWIQFLEDVYQMKSKGASWNSLMLTHEDVTFLPKLLPIKLLKVVYFGPHFLKIFMNSVYLVYTVKHL